MTAVAGPSPNETSCPHCGGIGTYGFAPADDRRYFGGYIDRGGMRHDPLRHRDDCPLKTPCAQCQNEPVLEGDYLGPNCRLWLENWHMQGQVCFHCSLCQSSITVVPYGYDRLEHTCPGPWRLYGPQGERVIAPFPTIGSWPWR